MADKIDIVNQAFRLLGVAPLTLAQLTADDLERARVVNDVYDITLDSALVAHPWNFAIKRAELTVVGGTITTWTASGTTNVWQAALTTEPARISFDGVDGTVQTSVAACDTAYYWFWESNVLYVYSTSDPDTAFTKIEAYIPEFEWNYAYSLPSDYLRAIKGKDDVEWVREGEYILCADDELKIQYIAQITDTTVFTPGFVTSFAYRLASEIAYPLTNSVKKSTDLFTLYIERLLQAKGIDAQEGIAQETDDDPWLNSRQ